LSDDESAIADSAGPHIQFQTVNKLPQLAKPALDNTTHRLDLPAARISAIKRRFVRLYYWKV